MPSPAPTKSVLGSFVRLNRLGAGIYGVGDVVGIVRDGLTRFECDFFMFGPDFADDVGPAVVPGNAGFAVHYGPRAMIGAEGLVGLPVGLQCDVEIAGFGARAGAYAHFPFAYEMVLPRLKRRHRRAIELKALHLGHVKPLLPTVFDDHHIAVLELDFADTGTGK